MPVQSFEQWRADLSALVGSEAETAHIEILQYFHKHGSSPAEFLALLRDKDGRGEALTRASSLLGEITEVEAMQDALLKSVKTDGPLN